MADAENPVSHPLPVRQLAAPAKRALAGAGINELADLTRFTEKDIADLHGIGANALKVLRGALEAAGLSFATA